MPKWHVAFRTCAHFASVYGYGPVFVAAVHALCCAVSSAADRLLRDSVLRRPLR